MRTIEMSIYRSVDTSRSQGLPSPRRSWAPWFFRGAVLWLSLFLVTEGAWGAPTEGSGGTSRELQTRFSLSERYDDNPSQGSSLGGGSNLSNGRQRGGGWVMALRSEVLFRSLTELSQLQLNYRLEREIFHGHSRLDNTSHVGGFQYTAQLTSRLRAGISDRLRIMEDVDSDLTHPDLRASGGLGGDEAGEPDQGLRFNSALSRSRKRTNQFGLFLEPKLSTRLGLRLDYTHKFTDVEVADEVDEVRQGLGASLSYLTDTQRANLLSLGYRLSIHRFDENEEPRRVLTPGNPLRSPGRKDGFLTHTVHLGYSHHLSPFLSLGVEGGVSRISSDNPEEDGEQSFTGQITLNQAWERSHFSLGYVRAIGSGGGGSAVLSQSVTALFSHQVSPLFQLSLKGSYSDHDSQGDAGMSRLRGGVLGQREDSTHWALGLNADYQPIHWWSATASYYLSTRNRKGGRPDRSTLPEDDRQRRRDGRFQSFRLGFHLHPAANWKADLSYTFSWRNVQRDSLNPGAGSSQNREEEKDPERNQLWLNFTWITPWGF
ncbi:MAG: hypothetical protein HYY20_10705 [Candidatus Tectomicrobia bacterium]|uniref:Uncharacterized protein n=1 Tax=Tectimicrobiota bacterium TaxID=2528274 RepID=A0A932CPW2_UNCTE|nr:hypothetical protein [Candidatus Tectomicrobia bacterium]